MNLPNFKWTLANLIAALIATAIFYGYGALVLGERNMAPSYYGVLFVAWFVVSLINFYAFPQEEYEEEEKTVAEQLRDMLSTFGGVVVLLLLFTAYEAYAGRNQRVQQLKASGSHKLNELVEMLERAGGKLRAGVRTVVVPVAQHGREATAELGRALGMRSRAA